MRTRIWFQGLLAALSILIGQRLKGMEHVFKLSNPTQISRWKIECPPLHLSLSKKFAGMGGYSLQFASPYWRGDMPEWPSCTGTCERKDWTGYDRLVIDVTNPGTAAQQLLFFFSDSKTPFRKGFRGICSTEGKTSKRFVYELKKTPKYIDRRDISVFHFFTERPGTAMEVFIGGIYLLRPGDPMPGYSVSFASELKELYQPMVSSFPAMVQATLNKLSTYDHEPSLKPYLQAARAKLSKSQSDFTFLWHQKNPSIDTIKDAYNIVINAKRHLMRLDTELKMLGDAHKAGQNIAQMVVGVASPMTKIMPRDLPNELEITQEVTTSLARNEREGIQIVVWALQEKLDHVKLALSPLVHSSGQSLNAEIDVVGLVKTKVAPPYRVNYVGWWPDPLLRSQRTGSESGANKCHSLTIRKHDMQSFWIRFSSTKKQQAGLYKGTLTVSANKVNPVNLPVVIRIYPFRLPDHAPLPTAIAFNKPIRQMTQKQPFSKMKYVYADFLANYKINYDDLYSSEEPDWDVIRYLHRKGQLTAFNLGYFGLGTTNTHTLREKFRPRYQKAKELNLLEHAYIYGFDEAGKDKFQKVETYCAALRKECPEVLTMTTTFDHSYGTDSVIKSMQAWCPLTPKFMPELAEKARTTGRLVWWYICCGPHNPYANWFIEYPAIETRMLMGAQTAKFKPDGFLYYALAIWNDNMGIDCEQGPFTTWNPVSWTVYHGDGSLFYCDKDGFPLPSIRLENYRDGLEDYAYYCILAEAVKRVDAKRNRTPKDNEWLNEAKQALLIPHALVASMKEYSHRPKDIMTWRNRMAEAIEKSGMENLNPWEENFGVRGWHKTLP